MGVHFPEWSFSFSIFRNLRLVCKVNPNVDFELPTLDEGTMQIKKVEFLHYSVRQDPEIEFKG